MKPQHQFIFVAAILSTAVCVPAQSSFRDLMDTASATMDAARESREQNAAPSYIRDIFAKAKEAEDDGNVNFCGFYVGMIKADADALVTHYGLKDGEWSLSGDPIVYSIHFSLKGVRRITKGGNSYEELCQAVANRVGNMQGKSNWKGNNREEWYEYKTIDGVRVTMAEFRLPNADIDASFNMVDTTGSVRKEAERKVAGARWKADPVAKAAAEGILAGMVYIPGRGWGCKMGKFEVTQAQWEAVMGTNPSHFKGDDNPVECVSWDDCQQFLSLLNSIPVVQDSGLTFRLPTNAEWEYACRAGATGTYCKLADGTEITEETLGQVAWFDDNSDKKTHPVGQKQPNAFGLYDMLGNVCEWCQEEYGAVASWAKGQDFEHDRINHGGGWDASARNGGGSRGRNRNSHSNRRNDLGFRLCADETDAERDMRLASVRAQIVAGMVEIPGEGYKMGKFEVTQAQWEEVMGTKCQIPNFDSQFIGDDLPAVYVSWDDCQEFLRNLNALPAGKESGLTFRLPTAAEWVYACRAGATGKYCKLADGTEITKETLGQVAWFDDNSDKKTHPVGQKKPNAFGLYDMHGNVSEWTSTADGDRRVERGGEWNNSAGLCESSCRFRHSPSLRDRNLGFRLCAD